MKSMWLFSYFICVSVHCTLTKQAYAKGFLHAFVGQLFEINVPISRYNLTKLPSWMCQITDINPMKYSGVPLQRDVGPHHLNDHITIQVAQSPQSIFFDRCKHRWPTILILFGTRCFSDLSPCSRRGLWKSASVFLKEYIQFMEVSAAFIRSLSVLAQWPHNYSSSLTSTAIVSFLGCGSLTDSTISILRQLEHKEHVDRLSSHLRYPIVSWMIADITHRISHRTRERRDIDLNQKDQYSLSGSSLYLYEKQQRQEWSEGRVIIEGSGPYDQPAPHVSLPNPPIIAPPSHVTKSPIDRGTKRIKSTPRPRIRPDTPKVVESNTVPRVNRRLTNVTVFIGSKLTYHILPDTYVDLEDGYGNAMSLKVYVRSADMQTDMLVTTDKRHWIYYVPDRQMVVLQPGKRNGGKYNLVVCAYDSHKNRICDGAIVEVLKPETIKIRTYISAESGVVWKYYVSPSWANDVMSSPMDSLDVTVQSSSLFEWTANTSTIYLITEASIAREHQLKMTAESKNTGRRMIRTIFATSVGHNAYVSATSVQIIIRLSILHPGKVPFSLLNTVKQSLYSAIVRHSIQQYPIQRDILIYRILDGRSAFMSDTATDDRSITVSMVFAPTWSSFPSLNCSQVVISPALLQDIRFKLVESRALWTLESVRLEATPGRCQQNLTQHTDQSVWSTTPGTHRRNNNDTEISAWLNRTINITVRNGFIFKTLIFPSKPKYDLIQSMELLDESRLVTDESSWVSVALNEYALFGLPLLENVRSRPYDFRLKVTLRSWTIHSVKVTILVDKFSPRFDHRFEMKISILDSDSQAHRVPQAVDQLLISQTLAYRWKLIQTVGGYLRSDRCGTQCGMDVFTHALFEQRPWLVTFSWSLLLSVADSPETAQDIPSQCEYADLRPIIRRLLSSDPSTDSMLSMFPASVSNISAGPNDNLVIVLATKQLGIPSSVSVIVPSHCTTPSSTAQHNVSSVLWSNITVFQGHIFVINLISPRLKDEESNQRIFHSQIYCTNESLCNLKWLRLSEDWSLLYGLPMERDIRDNSLFLLRIQITQEGNRIRNLSLRLTVLPKFEEKSHIVILQLDLVMFRGSRRDLDLRIRVAQLINQYLHPSCTTIKRSNVSTNIFKTAKATTRPEEAKLVMSCERAEDVVLHSLDMASTEDKVTVKWSQRSLKCVDGSVGSIEGELFEKGSSRVISRELIQFFANVELGSIDNVYLCVYGQCAIDLGKRGTTVAEICAMHSANVHQPVTSAPTHTKVVLLVLFLVIVAVACVCLGVYFLRRGIGEGISKLKSKDNLADHNSEPKKTIKTPLPNLSKKPKKLVVQDSSGINLTNNSPSTPLLSPFAREDSRSTRNMESMFNQDDTIGSYSFAASRAKSPDPEQCSSPEPGVPMCAVKQPTTSNVIRNPAMMMGSRLNPYRNIPPQII